MKRKGPDIQVEFKRVGEQLVDVQLCLEGWDGYTFTMTEAQLLVIYMAIGEWAMNKTHQKEKEKERERECLQESS